MFHAQNFVTSKKYRQKVFTTAPEDNPLIVQFCANNADTLLAAAKLVENECNGIDLNLGCPQNIARRGNYGAFLQDEWNLISEMVSKLRNNLAHSRSVSCKIRIFDKTEKTVQYAQMLEKAGCDFVAVHGRTREQRGCNTGGADWNTIKSVRDNIHLPVIANGNIQSMRDAVECLQFTGATAVMTAEGNLYNPALLQDIHPPAWKVARKYLCYVKQYPIPVGMAKSHLFKLFHRCIGLEENLDLRETLGRSTTLEQLNAVVNTLEARYTISDDEGLACDQTLPITVQPVPPYLCQPRFRYGCATPTTDAVKLNGKNSTSNCRQLASIDSEECDTVAQKRIKLQEDPI